MEKKGFVEVDCDYDPIAYAKAMKNSLIKVPKDHERGTAILAVVFFKKRTRKAKPPSGKARGK